MKFIHLISKNFVYFDFILIFLFICTPTIFFDTHCVFFVIFLHFYFNIILIFLINIIKAIFITKIRNQKVLLCRLLKNGKNLNQMIKIKRKKEKETKKGKLYRKTK